MKRDSKMMRFTSCIVLSVFFAANVVSCSSGGGGGAAPVPATTLTSAGQAAEAAPAALTSLDLGNFLINNMINFGQSGLPAPHVKLSTRANTGNLSKLDPRLQKLADSMAKQLQAPALKAAVKKARALGASRVPVNETLLCVNSGTVGVSGTDNSTATFPVDVDLTFTFNACRAGSSELSGSIRYYERWMYDDSSDVFTLTATNYTSKAYTDTTYATLLYTDVLNATFSDSYTGTTVGSGTSNGNGTYTYTEAGTGFVGTLQLNGLNDSYSWTSTTAGTDTLNGGFGVSEATGGTTTFSVNVSYSNFKNEWESISGTEDHQKYNGRVTINYTPDDAGCFEGVFDFTTPADKPLVLTSADGYTCPVSGTLKVNNATIVFGSPITITVGTQTPVDYADCSAMGAGMCTGTL